MFALRRRRGEVQSDGMAGSRLAAAQRENRARHYRKTSGHCISESIATYDMEARARRVRFHREAR